MKSENQICRLCLNTCHLFETITEATKEILNRLQLEIDLSKTDYSVICGKCSETIQKWFEFKSTCLQAQSYIHGKCYVADACLNKEENINRSDNNSSCCLCMKIMTPAGYFVSLTTEEKTVTSVKITLLKYFSEIVIKDAMACASCFKNLETYSTFITTCLETEKKLKKYCKDNTIGSTERIDLHCLLENKHFIWLNEIRANGTDINLGLDNIKTDIKYEPELVDQKTINEQEGVVEQNIYFVSENQNYTPLDEIKTEETYPTTKESTYDNACLKMDMTLGLDEEIDIKYEEISEQSSHKNTLIPYKLKKHTTSHEKQTHKCHICEYQTKIKFSLRTHMITHKSTSELVMHKCTECDFESKYIYSLRQHMITHNSSSEVTLHTCHICQWQTKMKSSLRRHMIIHKSASEVVMHKCPQCEYQTRIAYHLRQHMITHQSSSEVTMHKCTECSFETKHKFSLKAHMLVHKSTDEVAMYKCHLCEHQTKIKNSLRVHMMVHKSSSEVPMYKCHSCEYETKMKSNLNKHLGVHLRSSSVAMHRCTECSFETKRKNGLRQHMLVHRSRSDVAMHKCTQCSFETKYKFALKPHMLIHKSEGEVPMHKCNYCEYRSKMEGNLRRHMVVHRINSSDYAQI